MKKIKSLIKERKKFLAENSIEDWSEMDTIFVAEEYYNVRARKLLINFLNYYKRVHNDGIWNDEHVVDSYLIQSTHKPKK